MLWIPRCFPPVFAIGDIVGTLQNIMVEPFFHNVSDAPVKSQSGYLYALIYYQWQKHSIIYIIKN